MVVGVSRFSVALFIFFPLCSLNYTISIDLPLSLLILMTVEIKLVPLERALALFALIDHLPLDNISDPLLWSWS